MRPLVLVLLLIIANSLHLTAQVAKPLGRQVCVRCHVPEQRTLPSTPHDNDKACESCHGAGEQHLKSGGNPETMFSFARASAAQVVARCEQCHKNAVMEKHASGDVSCVSCHSVHHYARRKYLLKGDDSMNSARLVRVQP